MTLKLALSLLYWEENRMLKVERCELEESLELIGEESILELVDFEIGFVVEGIGFGD